MSVAHPGVRERHRIAATLRDRAREQLAHAPAPSGDTQDTVKALSTVGYRVLPGYFSTEKLSQLRREAEGAFLSHADSIQAGQGGDRRLFGAEVSGPALDAFAQDEFFARVGRAFCGPLATVTTMITHLAPVHGGESSGGGWHRDRFDRQFKAMLYLTDVGEDNGAFHILPRTKRPWAAYYAHLLLGTPIEQRRWTDDEMRPLLAGYPVVRLPGPAGTVILFDSSCIHRGSPLRSGERLALTNYYYEAESKPRKLLKKLKPIAGLAPLREPDQQTPG